MDLGGATKSVATRPTRNSVGDHLISNTAEQYSTATTKTTTIRLKQRNSTVSNFLSYKPSHFNYISRMFRNQYDTDVTVWSPEGRLLQVSSEWCRKDVELHLCVHSICMTTSHYHTRTPARYIVNHLVQPFIVPKVFSDEPYPVDAILRLIYRSAMFWIHAHIDLLLVDLLLQIHRYLLCNNENIDSQT